MAGSVTDTIRAVLTAHAKLRVPAEEVQPEDDLYQAGMTSHASVSVMLGLEDTFDIEFPDRMLTREVFASIASIEAAVLELTGEGEQA